MSANTKELKGLIMMLALLYSPLITAIFHEETTPVRELLEVTIYYEALCSDSKDFMCKQLYPCLVETDLLEFADLRFVPYGKVKLRSNRLTCQHGDEECELNALHACIVENNNKKEQLIMIHCLMVDTLDTCAVNNDIDVTAARQCKATRSTPNILSKYGQETNRIKVSYVPTIIIDGVNNSVRRWKNRRCFKKAFCNAYQRKYKIRLKSC